MVFHWSLSDNNSPQVSRTLLSILANLNNAVIWMVSTRPPMSKSSSSIINPLVTYQAQQLLLISLSLSCSIFFCSLARSRYLSFFSLSFSFTLWSAGTAKSTIRQVLFFCRWLSLGVVIIIIIIIYSFRVFHISISWWSFTGVWVTKKSHQVFRTLLSILAVLNNAVVWMVSTRPPTSNSSSPFNSPLVTVPNAPIMIGIIVTFIFRSFFLVP